MTKDYVFSHEICPNYAMILLKFNAFISFYGKRFNNQLLPVLGTHLEHGMTNSTIQGKPTFRSPLIKSTLAIVTAIMLATGLSACGEKHEAVTAPDKVDEAAEMARANAPEAEVIEFETTAAPAATTTEGTDTAAAEGDMATDAAAQPDTTEIAADADAPAADGTVPVVKEGEPALDEAPATDTTKVE